MMTTRQMPPDQAREPAHSGASGNPESNAATGKPHSRAPACAGASGSVRPSRRRDIVVAAACGVFAAFMVGMAYAAVPLYDWFCRTTGFAGRPLVATAAPASAIGRKVTVRFDANVTGGLPWKFEPEQNSIDVRIGDVITAFYSVTNTAARETFGQASYNVTPTTTGAYFNKINCFCFTEQRMAAGERREMPVVFYVDPALAKDHEHDQLNTITLSYTFYPVKQPAAAAALRARDSTSRLSQRLDNR